VLGAGGALLARHFTVVCADLRGYGDSAKPRCLPDRVFYAARMYTRPPFLFGAAAHQGALVSVVP
jgi:pimeloyl-ACP methyl ester carboxylesterase